ncbi:hypothetical protein ACFU8R_23815 [Pseudonocardia alni]|uniref:hypothetical protein n=1 Tax=Pseudonocardia TaxID=1847 RepID=UPI0020973F7B|nr:MULTISPECIES: hypothetical protein [Pseudonocardia]MCO7192038.1 hypothetical protein [Pseudonocardia sp. McavD-2-B]WFG47229.1 hypothetical protein PaSha_27570 [Pseudonocardia alni]
MRALLVILGSVGLGTGVLCAALTPLLPLESFTSAPTSHRTSAYESTLSITYDWSPSLAILPASGLILGLIIGIALHVGGWRLRRA